jgi:signal peptidase I
MMKELLEWVKTIVLALIIAGVITTFARPSLVIGPSMEPTLDNYNLLLMERITLFTSLPERGDVIVFKSNLDLNSFMKKSLIKRVIGIEGDRVRITGGEVYVNEQLMVENYISSVTMGEVDVVVPDGHIFVLGDNRQVSRDSRDEAVGFVKKNQIKGKAYIRVFPFSQIKMF